MLGWHSKPCQRVSLIYTNTELDRNFSATLRELQNSLVQREHQIAFLHSHLADFPENLGAVSDEQGERFHKDLKIMETQYQGGCNVHMMAGYGWSIKQDFSHIEHSRKICKQNIFP